MVDCGASSVEGYTYVDMKAPHQCSFMCTPGTRPQRPKDHFSFTKTFQMGARAFNCATVIFKCLVTSLTVWSSMPLDCTHWGSSGRARLSRIACLITQS